jgi:hypothetical protein
LLCGALPMICSMRLGLVQELRRLSQIADKHHMTTVHADIGGKFDIVGSERKEFCVLRSEVDLSGRLNISWLEISRIATWAFPFSIHRRLNQVGGSACL